MKNHKNKLVMKNHKNELVMKNHKNELVIENKTSNSKKNKKIKSPLKEQKDIGKTCESFESEITYGITNEIFTHCLNIIKKHINEYETDKGNDNNEGSITNVLRPILNKVMNTILNKVSPYLYSIMAILIVMFFMNCFQFYYYIKLTLTKNNTNIIKDTSFVL